MSGESSVDKQFIATSISDDTLSSIQPRPRFGGVHNGYVYGHIDPYLNAKHGYGFSNGYGYNQVGDEQFEQ